MNRELFRNVALFVELMLIGPLVGGLLSFLHGSDGGRMVTALVNSTPMVGLVLGIVVVALAAIVGVVDARLFGPRSGLAGAGIILGWASWRTGPIAEVLRTEGYPVVRLAIEGGIVGAAVVFAVSRIAAVSGPPMHGSGAAPPAVSAAGGSSASLGLRGLVRMPSLLAIGAAVIAGGLVAWLLAFHGAKGQALFAGWMAGIAAGAVAAIVSAGSSHSSDEGAADPVLTASAGMAILGVIAPLAVLVVHRQGLEPAILAGNLFRASHVGSFDWASGALIGVPVGLGWAGVHAQSGPAASPAAAG